MKRIAAILLTAVVMAFASSAAAYRLPAYAPTPEQQRQPAETTLGPIAAKSQAIAAVILPSEIQAARHNPKKRLTKRQRGAVARFAAIEDALRFWTSVV